MDKILRAISIAIVLFAAVTAFIVGSRIDQNTISLLSGTIIGILVAAPCAAIITMLAIRRRESNTLSSYDRGVRQSAPMPQNPPQYWVLPQPFAQLNGAAYMQPGAINAPAWPRPDEAQFTIQSRRRFYVIGENGEPRLLEDHLTPVAENGYGFDSDQAGAAF